LKIIPLGSLFAGLAAILYAACCITIRLSTPHLTAMQMVFGRSVVGLLIVVAAARLMRLEIRGRRRGLLIVTGFVATTGFLCLNVALMILPVFEALALLYLAPAFAALFSPWLVDEKIAIGDWVLIGVAFAGTLLVIWTGYLSQGIQWGHLLAAGAGLCYGLDITLIRKSRSVNNSLVPFFYISAVGAVVCLAPFIWQTATSPIDIYGAAGMLALGILAACAMLAINKALGMLASPNVAVISMLELPLASVGAFLLFDEAIGWRALIGAGLIIFSAVGLNLKSGIAGWARTSSPVR
jgi:drug/metabolite transporter (DMT)-like permease